MKYGALLFLSLLLLFSNCIKKNDGQNDNTVYASVRGNIKGLDPIIMSDHYSHFVGAQIYEGLMAYHYLKRPLVVIPSLAEDLPKVSEDGLTHTYKIKKGVYFHDNKCFKGGIGRELVANDFIYALKRLADPSLKGEGFWILDKKIKGLNEWRAGREKGTTDYNTPIEGIRAPDNYTLVFQLREPYFQLQYVLTMTYTWPVARECVTYYGDEYLNNPVGTGPYMLDSWVRNSKVILKRNIKWRGEKYPSEGMPGDKEKGLLKDSGKDLPFVDRVVIEEIIEDQPRWLNFMKGNFDFSGIPKDNFDAAIKNGKLSPELAKKGMALEITEEPDVTYTAFNMEDPLIGKNKKLRQAIAHAVDTKTLIERFYNGRAIKAHSPIPPGIDGYALEFKGKYLTFNIESAKKLLKEAGYPNGKGLPELNYDTTSSSTARQMAEFFKQELARIGIKLKIRTSTWPEFTKRQREKKLQIWGIAWLADYPDAQNFLQLLYGPNKSPGPNASNYDNPRYNKLYEKAMRLPPGPERTQVYYRMKSILAEDLPWITNVHRLGYRVYYPWLKNFKRHITISSFFKYLRIDSRQRSILKADL